MTCIPDFRTAGTPAGPEILRVATEETSQCVAFGND
jgi:hypothetical protein